MSKNVYKSAMDKIKVSTEFKNNLINKLNGNNVQEKSLKKVYKIAVIVAAILVFAIGAAVSADDINNFMFNIGKKQVEISNRSDSNEVIAIINGEEIYKKEFEAYKLITKEKDNKIVFEQLINDKILTQLAKEAGISVTDEEVENGIKSSKETYSKATDEQREPIQAYMKGAGISEEEYWERVKVVIPIKMMQYKYKEKMKAEYKKENNVTDIEFDMDKFDEYLKTIIEKEKSKVVIKDKNYLY
ncbi:MAG: hypothetical protein GX660_00430 [Clostridiaceae bacterium]|nr:hypothetical protein [Clostridiaceae bacterium]